MPNIENITDIIVSVALLLFFLIGLRKGLLRSLLGPLSLVASLGFAYYYYKEMGNIFLAGAILFFGPLLFRFLISLFFKLWDVNLNDKPAQSTFSQLGGGIISLAFRGSFFLAIVIGLTLIPENIPIPGITNIKQQVLSSKTYELINRALGDRLTNAQDSIETLTHALKNPDQIKHLATSEEYEGLMENNSFKTLVEDEKTQQLIKDKNYTELLKDKNFQKLLSDPDLIKQILAFQQKIVAEGIGEQAENLSGSHGAVAEPEGMDTE